MVVKLLHELILRHTLPIPSVKEFIPNSPEEIFTCGMIGRATLGGHGTYGPVFMQNVQPSQPTIVAATITIACGVDPL
jgi:hypothetical protein